jgi:hypothetical protein
MRGVCRVAWHLHQPAPSQQHGYLKILMQVLLPDTSFLLCWHIQTKVPPCPAPASRACSTSLCTAVTMSQVASCGSR